MPELSSGRHKPRQDRLRNQGWDLVLLSQEDTKVEEVAVLTRSRKAQERMTAEEVSSLAEALKIFNQAALAADQSIVSSTGSRDRSRPALGTALKRVEFRMLPLRHQEGLL